MDKVTGRAPPEFPFHYGEEAETYSFYRVPKVLFTEPVFEKLSTDAKLLYGLLLDRMQLSLKNKWFDDDGRVYVYFTVESVMEALGCGNKKASQLMAELDDKKGIGLITRVRQGQGKPDRIYVHKCILAGVEFAHFQTCQNDMSRDVFLTRLEMSKRHANNTDINKTDISENESIYPDGMDGSGYDEMGGGIYGNGISGSTVSGNGICSGDVYEKYRDYFWESLDFDVLKTDYPYEAAQLEEILELLTETVCTAKPAIRVSGEDKPAQVVKSRLLKLNSEHIRYVLGCMKENTTHIRNIRQYLLAALYNAPVTISSYYSARVNHDMYGGG